MQAEILTARVFVPLLQPARFKGAYGGRGSGKSHFLGGYLVDRAHDPGFRAVCVREVQKSLRDSAYQLIADKIDAHGFEGFTIQRDRILTPGGGQILFQGMQDHTAESVKSLEGIDVAWVEEAQTLSKRSLELLAPTIRKENSELWFSWNPRSAKDPVDQMFRGAEPPKNGVLVKANYTDNPWFPGALEQQREQDKRANPQRYSHIWDGEYEPAVVGSIWTPDMISDSRRHEAPEMRRVVVAVDPAASSEEGSNETGVVVCAVGADQRGYVLDDMTLAGGPHQWAMRAVAAFDRYDADAIVVERNQGGDMCKHTLRGVRPNLPVIEVTATRGKHVRAEPIAALYAMGRISHVGTFPELEAQMCLMTAGGYEGDGSPDRVDALVWGLTELFPQMTTRTRKRTTAPQRRIVEHGWMR